MSSSVSVSGDSLWRSGTAAVASRSQSAPATTRSSLPGCGWGRGVVACGGLGVPVFDDFFAMEAPRLISRGLLPVAEHDETSALDRALHLGEDLLGFASRSSRPLQNCVRIDMEMNGRLALRRRPQRRADLPQVADVVQSTGDVLYLQNRWLFDTIEIGGVE